MFRKLVKILFYIPYRLIFWTRVINKKELRKHKGAGFVMCCNHRSNSDVAALFANFIGLKLHFMGKAELFKNPVLGRFLRALNGFPVEKGKDLAVIRRSLEVLRKEEVMMMFPEGMRVFNPEDALAVRNGTAMIAIKAGAPIVPVVMDRAPRPFRLTRIKVGTTISTAEYQGRKAEKADITELSDKISSTLSGMLDGFEKKPRLKKWYTEETKNVRGITVIGGDKIVVIKRTRADEIYYVLPGGHVDEGEAARSAVVREVKEETNADVAATRVLYKYRLPDGVMQTFFLCDYKGGEVGPTGAEEYQRQPDGIGRDGRPCGTYEPLTMPLASLEFLNLKPERIKRQLVKDIKKYTPRLSRRTILVK